MIKVKTVFAHRRIGAACMRFLSLLRGRRFASLQNVGDQTVAQPIFTAVLLLVGGASNAILLTRVFPTFLWRSR
jgi:hypothetical protein